MAMRMIFENIVKHSDLRLYLDVAGSGSWYKYTLPQIILKKKEKTFYICNFYENI